MASILGATTSPGPLQQISLDDPNLLMGRWPLVVVPTFILPLSFMLHSLSLRRLRHDAP